MYIKALSLASKDKINSNTYSFSFEKPSNLKFKSGQYGLFIQPKLSRPHPFSISASPEEGYITFTTNIHQGSRFKKNLMKMHENNKILFLGPFQNFGFKSEFSNYVFLAQGIGITPFRSLLKHKDYKHLNVSTTLIHVSNGDHVFKDLTNSLADSSYYPNNSDEFTKDLKNNLNSDVFFIAGSSKFVKNTKKLLLSSGIDKNKIFGDSFFGYH